WADLAALAHRHAVKLHRGDVSGLPNRLLPEGTDYSTGASTAPLEVVPTDLVEHLRRLAQPTLLSSAELTSSDQDDIPITTPQAFANEREGARYLDAVLAILAASASQALHLTRRTPAPPLQPFLTSVRSVFPPVESPRPLGFDCDALAHRFAAWIEEGSEELA